MRDIGVQGRDRVVACMLAHNTADHTLQSDAHTNEAADEQLPHLCVHHSKDMVCSIVCKHHQHWCVCVCISCSVRVSAHVLCAFEITIHEYVKSDETPRADETDNLIPCLGIKYQ